MNKKRKYLNTTNVSNSSSKSIRLNHGLIYLLFKTCKYQSMKYFRWTLSLPKQCIHTEPMQQLQQIEDVRAHYIHVKERTE